MSDARIAELVDMLRKAERLGREGGADFVGIKSSDAKAAADALEQMQVSDHCWMEQAKMFQGLMTKAVQRAEKAEQVTVRAEAARLQYEKSQIEALERAEKAEAELAEFNEMISSEDEYHPELKQHSAEQWRRAFYSSQKERCRLNVELQEVNIIRRELVRICRRLMDKSNEGLQD